MKDFGYLFIASVTHWLLRQRARGGGYRAVILPVFPVFVGRSSESLWPGGAASREG